MVYVVSGIEAKWSNLTALKSSLQPHAAALSFRTRKLKHLTAQFADESVEYTIKGISIQYELLECAIKGKSINMNSEYSNSEPIKLSKSSYIILCHKIIYNIIYFIYFILHYITLHYIT